MKRNRPLSAQAQDLVATLALTPHDWCYGYELMKTTGIKSGTLYPVLMRLDERGLLESKWMPAETQGKPPRHAYRLTDAGLKVAHQAAATRPALANFKEQTA
jgi:PadR family transcriptional regulator, regulatory protein PadR